MKRSCTSLATVAILAITLLSGCAHRMTDFTVLSTKNTAMVANLEKGNRVTGEDCVVVVFFPWGQPNMKEAIDKAIEGAGSKYDALVDGVLYYRNRSFLFGEVCYEVSGTPVCSSGNCK